METDNLNISNMLILTTLIFATHGIICVFSDNGTLLSREACQDFI